MILQADALNMPLQDCSMDAVVTDPPYGLEFMGKEWDKFDGGQQERWQGRKNSSVRKGKIEYKNMTLMSFGKDTRGRKCLKCGHYAYSGTPCKCENPEWEQRIGTPPNMKAYQKFSAEWLTEAYRVLKPGGSMLVMGGTRTFHRLMCAIEDSGFIIKDTLMWIYGSGFPKAQDLGKMIDKRGQVCLFFNEIRELLKSHLEKSGKSLKEINQMFGFAITGSGMAGHWFANITQQTLPTKSQWLKLKEILSIPNNKFDDIYREIEPDKRPVIGKDKNWGKASDSLGMGGKEWAITLPYSDLAKHWNGFKVGGIKPAYEPIVWAVKPPEGSYVDNVLKHGVGAVNVDETRIESDKGDGVWGTSNKTIDPDRKFNASPDMHDYKSEQNPKGRFPANLILDEESAKVMDEQSGRSNHCRPSDTCDSKKTIWGSGKEAKKLRHKDNGGASRFFYCAKASRSERNKGLSEALINGKRQRKHSEEQSSPFGSAGFGNQNPPAKMSNNHPTVKPIALFEWLIKLVTREGQIVLDPFLGSGTTAISAHNTGRKCIGIEKETEYIEIAKRRVDYHEAQPKQMEMRV